MRDFWSSFLSFFNTFYFLPFLALSLYFVILKIFEEKTNFKFFFGWDGSGYTMNMKMGSCGYIDSGCILRNGFMRGHIFRCG
jgi:hypothetical protein